MILLAGTISGWGNDILNWVQDKGNWLVKFLPHSPFRRAIALIGNIPYMEEIAWFVPIHEMVLILMWWVSAIGVYYAYMIVLRWIKAID